jgi:peptidoglycan hydrolase-like protein with peptidoglycan-binding domain
MKTWLAFLISLCLAAGLGGAFAQNPNDFIRMFGGFVQSTIIQATQAEWNRLPPNELACIDQALQQQRTTVQALIQRGVMPTDGRLNALRSNCRTQVGQQAGQSPNGAPAQDGAFNPSEPTFDCGQASSPLPRLICSSDEAKRADWELAIASWSRYYTLNESDRSTFWTDQTDWLHSLNSTCRLANQNSTFARQQISCVINSYREHAAAYRSQLKGDALTESKTSPEQLAKIQQELIALGFLHDKADAEFGALTRQAIREFQQANGIQQGDFLSPEQRTALDRLAMVVVANNGSTSTQAQDRNQQQPQFPLPGGRNPGIAEQQQQSPPLTSQLPIARQPPDTLATVCPVSTPGTVYVVKDQKFVLTKEQFYPSQLLASWIRQQYGDGARLADWSDLVRLLRTPSSAATFTDAVGIQPQGSYSCSNAYVSFNGEEFAENGMRFFIARHNGVVLRIPTIATSRSSASRPV